MKKLTLLLTLSLLCIAATAQESALKKIEGKVSSLNSFKASVVFSTQGGTGGKAEYKGDMIVKGRSYAIKFGQMEIYSDGKVIRTYTPSRSEVVIENAPAGSGLMSSPMNFMAVSEKDFTVTANGHKMIGNTGYKTVSLQPKGEMGKNVKSVLVAYDNNYMPKEVTATTPDGLDITILINRITVLPILADSELNFDSSRAKEVIDFR